MDRTKYELATTYLEQMRHIDDVIGFIHNASEREVSLMLRETGFLSDPKSIHLTEPDIYTILQALENAKKELERAFLAL